MIKVLQKKFILAAMIAVTVLLVVLLGAINVFNFTSSTQDINTALDELVDSMQVAQSAVSSGGPFNNLRNGNLQESEITPSDDFESYAEDGVAYFSVTLDSEGNTLLVVMSGVASISQDDAAEMARIVFETKNVSGTAGEYKYKGFTSFNSTGITYVFLDTGYYKAGVLRVVILSVLAGMACWCLMFLLVFLLSKKFIRPIAVNIDRQKVFISDAGHEIKTPIAIIQANTEALELYNGENKWSRNIKEQTNRLSALVSNLLTLSKASETYEKPVLYDVDLAEIVAESAEMFKEPAAIKTKLINYSPRGPVMVKGDKEQFARIASLLMDNAVKYAPEMSSIDVEIRDGAKTADLEISNDCPQLPECEPERLFDRFYRPDESHNSSSGGTGIGLATVRAIAGQYGAKATCVYGEQRISFIVSFKKS